MVPGPDREKGFVTRGEGEDPSKVVNRTMAKHLDNYTLLEWEEPKNKLKVIHGSSASKVSDTDLRTDVTEDPILEGLNHEQKPSCKGEYLVIKKLTCVKNHGHLGWNTAETKTGE